MILALLACGEPPEPPAPVPSAAPLVDDVPAYPGLRRLCANESTLASGQLAVEAFATRDDPALVRAFYQKNAGAHEVEISGERLTLRVADDRFVLVGPKGQADYACGVAPGPADRTAVTVVRFTRR